MADLFRCRACGRSFPNRQALKHHTKARHRVRRLVTSASYLSVTIAVAAYLTYSGVFGWLGKAVVPPPAQRSLDEGKTVVMHIHPKIEIFVEGKRVTIPGDIGIEQRLWKDRSLERYGMPMPNMREMPYMSPLHTHDTSGIIHVESTIIRDYTLGEFFDAWGVPFTELCILDRCSDGSSSIVMLVNNISSYEFRNHVLNDGEQIRIEFKRG